MSLVMARASLRDVLYIYDFSGEDMSTYGSTSQQKEDSTSHTSGAKHEQKSRCNRKNTSQCSSSSRMLHKDLSVNYTEELTSPSTNAKPASPPALRKLKLALKQMCTCKGYYFWCLLIPVPIVAICIVSLINQCDIIHHDAVSLSNDTILAAQFKSCQSLAIIQTNTATEIKVYSIHCNELATKTYHQKISKSKSLHNVSVSNFAVYESDGSSNYFANDVSSEMELSLRAYSGGRVSVCHFTNYTIFRDFLRQEYINATKHCQDFIVDNTSDIHHYTSLFSYDKSTYYFVGIRVNDGLINYLHYNFTTKRSYYNMSDFTHGKFCHLSKEIKCNISLPFSDTCLLIHTENQNDINPGVFHQLKITGIKESERAKYIAATVLCLLVLFYLLYLYIMVCSKYVCTCAKQ